MATTDLDTALLTAQTAHTPLLSQWANTYSLQQHPDGSWWNGSRLVVVADDSLRRGVTSLYHDSPTAGHPGILKTCLLVTKDYWWCYDRASRTIIFLLYSLPPPLALWTVRPLSYLLHALPSPLLYYIRVHQYLLMRTLCAPFMTVFPHCYLMYHCTLCARLPTP